MDDTTGLQHDDPEVTALARPTPVSCQMIDFESADVLYDSILGYPAVIVHGEKPYAAMTVALRPLTYIREPEYWGYEVIGCLPEQGGVPEIVGPYAVVLPLAGAAIGKKGIEIIGASRAETFDIDMRKAGGSHEH